MKTRIEWLQELPDGYRERAVANCTEWSGNSPQDVCDSMQGAILGMCKWKETPDGKDFWDSVCRHYYNGSPLPPLPSGDSEKPNTHEAVNSPKHYNVNDKEVWQMMIDVFGKEAFVNFCALNAFKYRMRAGHKGDAKEDIDKALWYEAKMKELRG